MNREELQSVVQQALDRATSAAKAMQDQPLVPAVPFPTVRSLSVAGSYTLRFGGSWIVVQGDRCTWTSPDMIRDICDELGWDPRRVLRVVRRIQNWACYLERLAEGRQRHAVEICRQQVSSVHAIEAELAMEALTRGGRS